MATRECCDRCSNVRNLQAVGVSVFTAGPDGKVKVLGQGKRLLCPRCVKRLLRKLADGFAPIKQPEPATEAPSQPQTPKPEAGDDGKPAEPQPAAGRPAG